jgi:hypothetical protein
MARSGRVVAVDEFVVGDWSAVDVVERACSLLQAASITVAAIESTRRFTEQDAIPGSGNAAGQGATLATPTQHGRHLLDL